MLRFAEVSDCLIVALCTCCVSCRTSDKFDEQVYMQKVYMRMAVEAGMTVRQISQASSPQFCMPTDARCVG